MTNFSNLTTMSLYEFAEWLDENGMWDNSPWLLWFDKTYCQRCDSIKGFVPEFNKECKCAYCEAYANCRFFPNMDHVPDCKETITMWLKAEVENDV
jgi:hypothetical protein